MTRAIAALLEIMADTDAPLRRLIDATEGLLAYAAPEEAVEQAKEFLASVFEDANQHVDDRLDALKLMRKAEARKVVAPSVTAADQHASREVWRRLEIARRRSAMVKLGLWPPARNWADDLLGEGYVAPPGTASSSLNGLAEAVKEGRLRATTSPAKGS